MAKKSLSIIAEDHIMRRVMDLLEEAFEPHNRWEPSREQMAEEVKAVAIPNRFSMVITGGNDRYTEGTKK